MTAYTSGTPILDAVKRLLPSPALKIFLKTANECAETGQAHNDVMRGAWAAVKEAGYQRGKTGRWVMKDDPGCADVHVDVPMASERGGKKKKFPKAPAPYDEQQTAVAEKAANLLSSVAEFLSPVDKAEAVVEQALLATPRVASGKVIAKDAAPVDPSSLYVHRPLLNGADLQDWAKQQGFTSMLPPDDLHATVAYSRQPLDTSGLEPDQELLVVPAAQDRSMTQFGDASVLRFNSPELQDRWQQMRDAGASWDHDGYQPHLTVTYNGGGLDHDAMQAYDGPLIFGPEQFAPVQEDWADNLSEDTVKSMEIVKIDEEQRMVFGWASVISENGKPYEDSQGDIIDQQTLMKATTDFMIDVRRALAMHERTPDGQIDDSMVKGMVVHSFPIIGPIAKSLGIEADKEGWIVGLKINDDHTWQLVKSGKLRAFSIGGQGQRVPVAAQ